MAPGPGRQDMAIDTRAVATSVSVRRLTGRSGAERSELELRNPSDAQMAEVRAALYQLAD